MSDDVPLFHQRNFLGCYDARHTSYDGSYVLILPAPFEYTVCYGRGTRDGPRAIIEASRHLEPLDEELGFEPLYAVGVHTLPTFAAQLEPGAYVKGLGEHATRHFRKDKFLLTLGGEHTVTEGPLMVVSRAYPNLSILHIDAHADLRDEYYGTPYSHACAARRMMHYVRRIVQVGIRSVSKEELKYCNTDKVRTHLMIQNRDLSKLIPKVVEELSEHVYVSIDVDGLDPSVIPGTGTPVPGGLGWYETLDLLREVAKHRTIVSGDITELAPVPDMNQSEFTAAKLAYKLIGYVAAKKLGRLPGVRSPRTARVKG
jgi:agmatinase